jgi:MscS family membrane protein
VILPADPRLRELLISLAILAASYLAARLLSLVLRSVLARGTRRAALSGRLASALERPLAYALFLVGAYAAVHRSPLPPSWIERLDATLFVLSVLLLALATIRAYRLLLTWYTGGSGDGLAAEFDPLLSKLGAVAISLVALITILQRLGVNVESLVVSLGIGSLAVGLAAQDTLANMFAGFALMLDRPFRIGDRIQLASGEIGDVVTIGIRATRVRTLDETLLVVPNSVLTREKVVNLSQPTLLVTTRIDVGVAYGTDLQRAKTVLAEAAAASEYVVPDRAPVVLVTQFADSSVNMRLIFWTRDVAERGLATSQVHEEVARRFAEAGIEIPFPVRRVIQEVAR